MKRFIPVIVLITGLSAASYSQEEVSADLPRGEALKVALSQEIENPSQAKEFLAKKYEGQLEEQYQKRFVLRDMLTLAREAKTQGKDELTIGLIREFGSGLADFERRFPDHSSVETADMYRQLGQAYFYQLKDEDAALRYFNKALELNENEQVSKRYVALIQERKSNEERARQ